MSYIRRFIVSSIVIYIAKQPIENVLKLINAYICSKLTTSLAINIRDCVMINTINRYLYEKSGANHGRLVNTRTYNSLKLPYGTYKIYDPKLGYLFITIKQANIFIRKLNIFGTTNIKELLGWANDLRQSYFKNKRQFSINMLYKSPNSGAIRWSAQTTGSFIDIKCLPKSDSMDRAISIVDHFHKNEQHYRSINKPYKIGMLLHGKSRMGKTLFASYVATKYKKQLYSVQLNTFDLDDCTLGLLFCNIGKNSVILLDELDHMLE